MIVVVVPGTTGIAIVQAIINIVNTGVVTQTDVTLGITAPIVLVPGRKVDIPEIAKLLVQCHLCLTAFVTLITPVIAFQNVIARHPVFIDITIRFLKIMKAGRGIPISHQTQRGAR